MIDHGGFSRRSRLRQDRVLDRLAEALQIGLPVHFVGVTGIGYPRSFYRLHWRIGKVWHAAEGTAQKWPAPSKGAEYREAGGVSYVQGAAPAVADYDYIEGRAGLREVMTLVRAMVKIGGNVQGTIGVKGWRAWVALAEAA